jgi:Flp pilus assembly protein TadD
MGRLHRFAWVPAAVMLASLAFAATPPPTSTTSGAAKPKAKPPAATHRASTSHHASGPEKPPLELAAEARGYEEMGAYGHAADALRALRRTVPPDADLELALALDEARSGRLDSARARLWDPVLTAAMSDSLPASRRHAYAWKREPLWINGRFDGWHWYVARARTEVAASLGRWSEAEEAAKACVVARPRAGKEWLMLAVSAGKAGDAATAQTAVSQAAYLDASLPEAQYLEGLYLWKAGTLSLAQRSFHQALALDSIYRAPALALVRSRLPGARPDSLPSESLTGTRAVGLLTSDERPKLEEFAQMDASATLLERVKLPIPDSLHTVLEGVEMAVSILIDERGRIALHDFPWVPPDRLPPEMVNIVTATLPGWRFDPAKKNGVAQRSWSAVQLKFQFNN